MFGEYQMKGICTDHLNYLNFSFHCTQIQIMCSPNNGAEYLQIMTIAFDTLNATCPITKKIKNKK